MARAARYARRGPAIAALGLLLAIALATTSCSGGGRPVVVSREALGTVVSITAYAADGADETAVREAVERAFELMAQVEGELDAYDPASAISVFNRQPYTEQQLPNSATAVLEAVADLDLEGGFSPALLGVTRLYDFEGSGTVPAQADLDTAVAAAAGFIRTAPDRAVFARLKDSDPRLAPGGALSPGLDFGGAAKGLALDWAREELAKSSAIAAALISAGSTSVTVGTKPDGSVWRIGIEDPRETGRVVAVAQFEGDGALSTSGDYQRAFEVNGVLYHHILDPLTGSPVRGIRSLTVAGTALSGTGSDILSTALFVNGVEQATGYARAHGLALYIVDAEGRTHVVPAPGNAGLTLAEEAAPNP